jgi:taurine dioxygenase
MTFDVDPLPGKRAFGAVIRGLTREAITDPATRAALRALWIDKGLLVFRGMQGGRDTQMALSQVFGDFEIHPVVEARMPEQQELTALVYEPGSGALVDVDGEKLGAYLPWHSDLIYVDRINRGGLLRAVQISAHGGHTGFIDQIELYDSLPRELAARVGGLHVIYYYDPFVKKFGKPAGMRAAVRRANPEQYSYVAHPMVFTQAETGRKVLNVSPWFATEIEGMENAEGEALLARIVEHCEDDSRAYYHAWQQDDLVLWDNWRMLHCCTGVPDDEARRVERTTIRGDYQLGRIVRGGPAFSEAQRISV